MTDLHSAAFGEFLPACLGLPCFLLSPPLLLTANQQASCRSSSLWNVGKKLADFAHWSELGPGGEWGGVG